MSALCSCFVFCFLVKIVIIILIVLYNEITRVLYNGSHIWVHYLNDDISLRL